MHCNGEGTVLQHAAGECRMTCRAQTTICPFWEKNLVTVRGGGSLRKMPFQEHKWRFYYDFACLSLIDIQSPDTPKTIVFNESAVS